MLLKALVLTGINLAPHHITLRLTPPLSPPPYRSDTLALFC